jgi:hypothetical protein
MSVRFSRKVQFCILLVLVSYFFVMSRNQDDEDCPEAVDAGDYFEALETKD